MAGSKSGFRKLNMKAVTAALHESNGLKTVAAGKLAVHRDTLWMFWREHQAELDEVQRQIKQKLLDAAEQRIWKAAIEDGDVNALKFCLERQGRDRGWGHQLEFAGRIEWVPPRE